MKDIFFEASRTVDMGFTGYELSNPPSLTEDAQNFLREYGPDKFADRFGHYFVTGTQKQASVFVQARYSLSD